MSPCRLAVVVGSGIGMHASFARECLRDSSVVLPIELDTRVRDLGFGVSRFADARPCRFRAERVGRGPGLAAGREDDVRWKFGGDW